MNKKQKIAREKIIISSLIYIICILTESFFSLPPTASLLIYFVPYIIGGYGVLEKVCKNLSKGQIFDEKFLMTIATLAAFVIGEYSEGVATMILYQIGELFENYAVNHSRKSISSLIEIMPQYAALQTENGIEKVNPEDVTEGSIIIVKPGEKVPIDGVIIEGKTHLDTSAITGESVHISATEGDEIYSGSVNCEGLLTIKTTKSYQNSTVSKILELVEDAQSQKAPAENFISKFAKYYTPIVVMLAVALSVVTPLLLGESMFEGIRRGCIFLVVSCPCALVISVPLSFFGGIGAASKKGILVKGSTFLDMLSKTDTILFDKTGTLTEGVFDVIEIFPYDNKNEIIYAGALCEALCNHPIALSVKRYYKGDINTDLISEYHEIAGKGTRAVFEGNEYLCGNAELMRENGVDFTFNATNKTTVYVAKNSIFLGYIVISDKIKKGASSSLSLLRKAGIKNTIMLSGDNERVAQDVAKELGLSEVHSKLLPDKKVAILKKIMESHSNVAYVGDGINDAPVLVRADIGISMGNIGSDAAIEASDVVLVNDDLSKLPLLIKISRKTVSIAKFNIVFAIGVKAVILLLGSVGIANMWLAIFADVGVSVLAILNSMRTLSAK